MIPKVRKKAILRAFNALIDEQWIRHCASIEHLNDGRIRAILALETGSSPAQSSGHSQSNSQLGTSDSFSLCHCERLGISHQDNIAGKMDIANQKDEILDSLFHAVFEVLVLPSSISPSHSSSEGFDSKSK